MSKKVGINIRVREYVRIESDLWIQERVSRDLKRSKEILEDLK